MFVGYLSLLAAVSASPLAPADKEFDLILFGATGCVGHLAAEYLATQPSTLTWAIADINSTRLEALAKVLQAAGGPASAPTQIVATTDGKTDLAAFVSRTRVLATAAGPFSIHGGEAMVKACANAGVHYVDISDEFFWQREMTDRYDAVARASGATIILASGFCALAGDLGAQLAIAALNNTDASAEIHVDAWLEKYNGGLSAGVIATKPADKNASYPKAWDTDPYVLAPNASAGLKVDTLVQGMEYPEHVKDEGEIVENIFGPYDARLLRRTFTQRDQTVHLRVGALPRLYTEWLDFLALHPGGWPTLTKCPAPVLLKDGAWAYRFHASIGDRVGKILLSGRGDPGYHFTSVGMAETALCLAGLTPGCDSEKLPRGVVPPMAALDAQVMIRRLESINLVTVTDMTGAPGNISGNISVSSPLIGPNKFRALVALKQQL